MRKHFIDNLRWIVILLLIPYHASQAFNTWGELNYICFSPDKAISSFIVFFSPFYMPLMFLLAGISTRYALKKRTYGQFILERTKRLMIPFIFGTLAFCPILAYIGDKTNCGYDGGFFEHYEVFFTRWTDLSGFDGGFGVGQFWFLYFLFVISVVSVGIIALVRKISGNGQKDRNIPFGVLCLFVIPLPFLYDLLVVGGKSFAEYLYVFLIGYYVLSNDKVIEKTGKYCVITLLIGIAACAANVYMFIWSGKDFGVVNVVAKAFAEWFMILGSIGAGKKLLDHTGKVSGYLSQRSFIFFSIHFLWIVMFQYWFSRIDGAGILLTYPVSIVLAYAATFVCSEVCYRIPFLCFLMGAKPTKS
ncbi:MAG: acyltransferase [Saccharofermentans sp.]|nr:acyltransferase [Saccharofermentans sp.]